MKLKKIFPFFWFLPFLFFIAGYFFINYFYKKQDISAPDIVGKSICDAASALSKNKLNLRIIKEKEDATFTHGTILSQDPKIGKKIKQNQTVFVTVATNPPPAIAPFLVGKNQKEINQALKDKGLRSKVFLLNSNQPQGICLAQIPKQNEPLDNKKITIYVSSGNSKSIIMPDFKGLKISDIASLVEDNKIDLEITHSSPVEDEHKCSYCIIEHQKPLSGTLIAPNKKIILQLQVR